MNDSNVSSTMFRSNKYITMLYTLLICSIIATLVYVTYFAYSVHMNSIGIFNNLINSFFNSIPIIGKLLNEQISNLQIIDYVTLYDDVISKAITAEALYVFSSLGLIQVLALIFINKFRSKDKIVYFYITIMITAVLLVRKPNLPVILPIAYSNTIRKLNITLNSLLVVQLLLLMGIYYFHYKNNNLDSKEHSTVNNSLNKTQKYSKIILTATLLIFSLSLAFAQYKTLDIENVIITDYVVEVEQQVNDQIALIVPQKVVDFGYKYGIKINSKLNLGDMLHKAGLSNVDLSKIISTYILNITNTGRMNMITTPLYVAVISIILVVILYALRIYERRISNNSFSVALAGLLFSLLLFFFVSKFGYLTALFAAPTVLIYLINIMFLTKQSVSYNKTKHQNN